MYFIDGSVNAQSDRDRIPASFVVHHHLMLHGYVLLRYAQFLDPVNMQSQYLHGLHAQQAYSMLLTEHVWDALDGHT